MKQELDFEPIGKVTASKGDLFTNYVILALGPLIFIFFYITELQHPILLILAAIYAVFYWLIIQGLKKSVYYWNDEKIAWVWLSGKPTYYSYSDIVHVEIKYGKLGIFFKNKKSILIKVDSGGIKEFAAELDKHMQTL